MNIRLADLPAIHDKNNGRSTRDDRIAFQIGVMRLLARSPSTTPTISMEMNASYKSSYGHLKALEVSGLIIKEKIGRTYWWRLA